MIDILPALEKTHNSNQTRRRRNMRTLRYTELVNSVLIITALLLETTNGEDSLLRRAYHYPREPRAVKSQRMAQVMMKKQRYHGIKKNGKASRPKWTGMKKRMMVRGKGTAKSPSLPKSMYLMKTKTAAPIHPTPAPYHDPASTESPTSVPTVFLDEATYRGCLIAMAISDANRDDIIDREDYVRFVNRLTRNAYVGDSFGDLDEALTGNFEFLALVDVDGIDARGSKPMHAVDDDTHLRRACTYTITALADIVAMAPTRAPASSSPPRPSPPLAYNPAVCFLSMVIADRNRDERLDEAEYVLLIQRLSDNAFADIVDDFDDLDFLLRQNFARWATPLSSGGINNAQAVNITGSRPDETPSARLIEICRSTQEAIEAILLTVSP